MSLAPQISLVIPLEPERALHPDRLAACCSELEARGYSFEVLIVGPGAVPPLPASLGEVDVRMIAAPGGLAPAAVAGLEAARADTVVILDEGMGYDLADVGALVEPLIQGRCELVIGSRLTSRRRGPKRLLGQLFQMLVGTTDPLSGLIGVRRSAYHEAVARLTPVGSKFSFELLAKVDGRVEDVQVHRPHRRRRDMPTWDDVRHWKRLADHKFGNFSRLVQFCGVGASGMCVDLTTYALAQSVLAHTPLLHMTTRLWRFEWPSHLAVSAVIAVGLALVWNFTLNRRLTFNDARSGSIFRQFFTYALSNAVSVPFSLFLRLQLPEWSPFFERHRLVAAVVGIVAATMISFSMARWIVFRKPHERKLDGGGDSAVPTGQAVLPDLDKVAESMPARH